MQGRESFYPSIPFPLHLQSSCYPSISLPPFPLSRSLHPSSPCSFWSSPLPSFLLNHESKPFHNSLLPPKHSPAQTPSAYLLTSGSNSSAFLSSLEILIPTQNSLPLIPPKAKSGQTLLVPKKKQQERTMVAGINI